MKRSIACLLILLAACKPQSSSNGTSTSADAAPSATPAQAPTQTSSDTAPAKTPVEPIAQTHGGAAAPSPAASGEADNRHQVNQRIAQVLGDPARYETAILAFQQAVQQKDAATVAAMIDFPFKTRIDGKPITIPDATAFIAQYGRIVTPPIADAIVQQRYSDLFVNQKGVMFGKGEAWLNGVCTDAACASFEVRVIALQPAQ